MVIHTKLLQELSKQLNLLYNIQLQQLKVLSEMKALFLAVNNLKFQKINSLFVIPIRFQYLERLETKLLHIEKSNLQIAYSSRHPLLWRGLGRGFTPQSP